MSESELQTPDSTYKRNVRYFSYRHYTHNEEKRTPLEDALLLYSSSLIAYQGCLPM